MKLKTRRHARRRKRRAKVRTREVLAELEAEREELSRALWADWEETLSWFDEAHWW